MGRNLARGRRRNSESESLLRRTACRDGGRAGSWGRKRNGRRSLAAPAPDRRPADRARSRGCGRSSGAPCGCLGTDSAGYPPTDAPAAGPRARESTPAFRRSTDRSLPWPEGTAMRRGGDPRARAARHGRTTHRIARAASAADRCRPQEKSRHPGPGRILRASVPAAASAPVPSRLRTQTPRDEEILPERLAGCNKKCRIPGRFSNRILININKHDLQTLSTNLSTVRFLMRRRQRAGNQGIAPAGRAAATWPPETGDSRQAGFPRAAGVAALRESSGL